MHKAFSIKHILKSSNLFIRKFKPIPFKHFTKKAKLATTLFFTNAFFFGKIIFFDEPKEQVPTEAQDERKKKIEGLARLAKVLFLTILSFIFLSMKWGFPQMLMKEKSRK